MNKSERAFSSSPMRIVLLRHGKPDVPEFGKLSACEIHLWIKSYNAAGLKTDHSPSRKAVEMAKLCNTIVCSDLPRSVESARALGVEKTSHVEPMFREMGLPYASFPSPKFSPSIWAALFRVLWFFGYASNSESLREARVRAAKGASRLKELAARNGSVLLVGHGFVNKFIAKELLSNGWHGPASPGKKYWEFGVYEYAT